MPAPPPRVLPINAGLSINGNKITDHNRGPITMTPTRIENRKRMADGTLRVFTVAQKWDFKASWENVPYVDARTVDGFWGMKGLGDFYNSTFAEFTLTISFGDGTHQDFTVMFKDFNKTLRKRGAYVDLYTFDASWEQV